MKRNNRNAGIGSRWMAVFLSCAITVASIAAPMSVSAEEVNQETAATEMTEEFTPELVDEVSDSARVEAAEDEELADDLEFAAEEPVEFYQSDEIDDVTVTVSADAGVFPEEATLSVSEVESEVEEAIADNVDAARDEEVHVAKSYTFDIKVLDAEGNELQPDTTKGQVQVSFAAEEVKNENLEVEVYHISDEILEDDEKSAEKLDSEIENVDGEEMVVAETTGFSYYTVEFTYNNLQYVMSGDSSIPLANILAEVRLTGTVTNAVSSNPELFSVDQENGVWMVHANQAFSSEEWLKVTIGEIEYTIQVTDDQVNVMVPSADVPTEIRRSVYLRSGTYTLTDDIKIYNGGQFKIERGNEVTINMNGKSITEMSDSSAPIFYLLGTAKLTINGVGTISGNNYNNNADGAVIWAMDGEDSKSTEIAISNVTIKNFKTNNKGGVVKIYGKTNLTIDTCVIEGCTANYGGAIYSDYGDNDKAFITISNTTIKACRSSLGGAIELNGDTTLKLNGKVTITENTNNNNDSSNIYIDSSAVLTDATLIDASNLDYENSSVGITVDRTDGNRSKTVAKLGNDLAVSAQIAACIHNDKDEEKRLITALKLVFTTMHVHRWTYNKVNGTSNSIKVKCATSESAGLCLYNTDYIPSTVTVDASRCGQPYKETACPTALVIPSANWPTKELGIPSVLYAGIDETTYESATCPSKVGKYQASITVGEETATDTFVITKVDPEVTAPTAKSLTYNGSAQELVNAGKATHGTTDNSAGTVYYRVDGGSWSTRIPTATNVKRSEGNVTSYKVYYYVKGDTNHNDVGSETSPAGSVDVTITPITLTADMITKSLSEAEYTGSAMTQEVTVSVNGTALTRDVDYKISNANALTQTEVGEYSITVTGIGNYTSEALPVTWRINSKDFAAGDIVVEDYNGTYDGQEHGIKISNPNNIPGFKVLYATSANGEYSETPITKKNVTETPYTVYYKVTATGYKETAPASKTITITKRAITVKATENQSKVYGAADPTSLNYQITNGSLVAGDTLSGELKRAEGENAGEYAIGLGTLANANYDVTLADDSPKFKIVPRPVNLRWSNTALTYTGGVQKVEASVTNKVNVNDVIRLTYKSDATNHTVNEATEVGTYRAMVTGLSNPNYTLEGAENTTQQWGISYLTANARLSGTKPADSAWYTSDVIVEPVETGYTISRDDMNHFGDSVVVSDNGTNQVTFYLKDTNGHITDRMTQEIKIDKKAPTAEVKVANNTFKSFLTAITFGYFFKDTVDVTITGSDQYSGVKTIEYQKVESAESYNPNGTWTLGDVQGTHLSVAPNAKFIVYARVTDQVGHTTVISTDGIVVFHEPDASAVEEYTKKSETDLVTKINTNGNTIDNVTIQNVTDGSNADTTVYTIPEGKCKIENGMLVLDRAYLDGLAAGTHKVTVSYNPYGVAYPAGYDKTSKVTARDSVITLTVKRAAGTVTITNDISKTYNRIAVAAPTFTKTSTGEAVIAYKKADAEDSTYTTTAPSNAGAYKVRVSVAADADYAAAEVEKAFTISKAAAKITIPDAKKSYQKTYGDSAFALTEITKTGESAIAYSSNNTNVAAVDTKTGMVTILGAGTTELSLTMAESENYQRVSAAITVTVEPKRVTVTPTGAEKIYGTEDPVLTYGHTELVGSDALSAITVTRDAGDAVGTYPMTASQPEGANKNYTITFASGTFTIKPKDVSVGANDITISGDGSFVFDGSEKTPKVVVWDGTKVIPDSEYTVSYVNNVNASKDADDNTKKPTVIISDAEGGNYTVHGSKRFEIAKADPELSVSAVASKTYGDPEFTLAVTKTGESKPTFTSKNAAIATVDDQVTVKLIGAGKTSIVVAMAESTNYNAKSVTVDLTVEKKKAALAVTTMSYEVTYGDADFTITDIKREGESTIAFTNSNDSVATVDQNGKVAIQKVGETTITLSMEDSANYNAVTTTVKVKVVPKEITVQADGKKITYGDPEVELSYTATGLVGEDQLTDISLARAEGTNVGVYEITASQKDGANSNYDITFQKGAYMIEPKSIQNATVTLGSKLTANGDEQKQTVKAVVIDGLDTTYQVADDTATAAGTYALKITGTGNFKDTITKTFVVVDPEKPANQNQVHVDAVVDDKAPETVVTTPKAELMEMVMTADEMAAVADLASLSIWIEVKDADETISETSKKQIEAGTSDYTIGSYIDISLYKQLSTDAEKTQIETTAKPIRIAILVPAELLNKDATKTRTYAIVRNHEGKVEILPTNFDEKTGTLTFETNQFSDYAIIYQDAEKVDEKGAKGTGAKDAQDATDTKGTKNTKDTRGSQTVRPGRNRGSRTGDALTPQSTRTSSSQATAPKTGDDFHAGTWMLLLMLGLAGLVGAVSYKKKIVGNKNI